MRDELLDELVSKGILIGDEKTGYTINPYLEMPKSLSYEDVALTQAKSVVRSRSEVDTTSEAIRGVFLSAPLMAANMSTVTNGSFAHDLRKLGAMGVIHRAWPSDEDYIREVYKLALHSDSPWVAASVGANPSQVELAKKLMKAGANVLFIDIAHGFSDAVYATAKAIKQHRPDAKVVVGNTINTEMMHEFDDVADAVKVGIAQGLACETKDTAGVTEKMFSSVLKFKEVSRKLGLPIIADGGVRKPSDVVKAIAAGANSVMMGSVFARCPESAGEIVDIDGQPKKVYSGMASRAVQERWHGEVRNHCPEGKTLTLELGEPVKDLINRYVGALKSGISYTGANDIGSFQLRAKFIRL